MENKKLNAQESMENLKEFIDCLTKNNEILDIIFSSDDQNIDNLKNHNKFLIEEAKSLIKTQKKK